MSRGGGLVTALLVAVGIAGGFAASFAVLVVVYVVADVLDAEVSPLLQQVLGYTWLPLAALFCVLLLHVRRRAREVAELERGGAEPWR